MINTLATKPLSFIADTANGTNTDDYTNAGIYFFSYSNRPAGLPSIANGNGWLIVLEAKNPGYAKQIWISLGSTKTSQNTNHLFTRGQFNDEGWSDWVQIPISEIGGG